MRVLGIDYGSRRVGIALSDEAGMLAFPREVVAQKDALAHILFLLEGGEIGTIVLGESKNFQGTNNPIQEQIRAFKALLETKTTIPIMFEPEFMTSAAAARYVEEGSASDASAAALILQSFLDRQKTG